MLVLGAIFGWFGRIAIQARRQQKIVAMIHEMGGEIGYRRPGRSEYFMGPPRGPWLLRDIFGRNAFGEVAYIHFRVDVSDADLARLVELAYLELVIAQGTKITDVGLAHLARLPNLSGLNLSETTITKAGLEQLVSARQLRELTLGGSTITDETLEGLASLQDLTTLQLFRTSISSAGLAPVGRLPKLEKLDVIDAIGVGDDAIVHLMPLRALKQLRLHATSVGDDGVRVLTAFNRIECLSLERNKITDAGFANVNTFKNLTRLRIQGISDRCLRELKELVHLKQFSVTGANITDACTDDLVRLARASHLEHLDLTLANITQSAVTALSHRIPECNIRWCDPKGGTIFRIKDGLQSSKH